MTNQITTYEPRFVVYYDDKTLDIIVPYTGLMKNYKDFCEDVRTSRFVIIEGHGLNTYHIMKFNPVSPIDTVALAILGSDLSPKIRIEYWYMYMNGKITSTEGFHRLLGDKKRTTAAEYFQKIQD